MLQLKNIFKVYKTGEFTQSALKDVSVNFRKNEFVSVLGPSGSGKTTLLNIVGGLDRYDNGDLKINGRSTKEYKDRDWDLYRNSSVGFVFQSYNLISHQSVLSNVELALTLAGVSKKERRKRALDALTKVGLQDHINKRPNQLSGGQMQRVAIARALVNNPEILLADEPTGALDSETSVQIMGLLEEIAHDRLVIMVTHNPELAEKYSTRIIKLLDGKIISDSNPYSDEETGPEKEKSKRQKNRLKDRKKLDRRRKLKTSMSFATALSLSFNNLRTKKGRTLLTSLAGSIGITGIALIISLSTGIQAYVNSVQQDTLSSYPISITEDEDTLGILLNTRKKEEVGHELDAVYSNDKMQTFFNSAFVEEGQKNNLTDFKEHLDEEMEKSIQAQSLEDSKKNGEKQISEVISSIQYQYNLPMNTYVKENKDSGEAQEGYRTTALEAVFSTPEQRQLMDNQGGGIDLWTELMPKQDGTGISDLIFEQYELVNGRWPDKANELVVVLDENNELPDVAFYSLGLISEKEVQEIMASVDTGEKVNVAINEIPYEEILNISFKLLLNKDYYVKNPDGTWRDIREEKSSMELAIEDGYDLDIVGIIRPVEDSNSKSIIGSFAYTSDLTKAMIEETNNSEIIKDQEATENENYDILTGLPFELTKELELTDEEKAEEITDYFASLDEAGKSELYEKILATPTQEEIDTSVSQFMEEYPDRESLIGLAEEAFELTHEQAKEYVSNYSDEELKDFMTQAVTEEVKTQFGEQAQGQVYQIKSQAPQEGLYNSQGDALVAQVFDQQIAPVTDMDTLVYWYDEFMPNTVSESTLSENLNLLGNVNVDSPSTINIYANLFEDKEEIDKFIKDYNGGKDEEDQIEYTDYVGLIMSGVTIMINAVTYGLIAFVSISLIVSSIMIGIITYISVLERTKEIGILRSIGASKKDISRVFNAETIIVGFTAGLIGIGLTLILNIPISYIMEKYTDIPDIAHLTFKPAAILILLSMCLTFIAGLIPSRMAAKKDPVIALRTE